MSEGPNQFDRFVPNLKPSETPVGGTFRRAGDKEVEVGKVVDFRGTREAQMQEEMLRLRPEGPSKNEERERNIRDLDAWLMKEGLYAQNLINPSKIQARAANELGVPPVEVVFCAQAIVKREEEKRRRPGAR